jgi:hypothetical protein
LFGGACSTHHVAVSQIVNYHFSIIASSRLGKFDNLLLETNKYDNSLCPFVTAFLFIGVVLLLPACTLACCWAKQIESRFHHHPTTTTPTAVAQAVLLLTIIMQYAGSQPHLLCIGSTEQRRAALMI